MKVALIYYRYLDDTGSHRVIGGVETYLGNLAEVIRDLGWEIRLFQSASRAFETRSGAMTVTGLPIAGLGIGGKKRSLYRAAMEFVRHESGVLVFGADHASVPCEYKRAVSIQHGVAWDLPARFLTRKAFLAKGLGGYIKKAQLAWHGIRDFDNCRNRVCVDYNFLNWYRTTQPEDLTGRVWVIPNATRVPSEMPVRSVVGRRVKVLFARRFTEYRGTRLMIAVAEKLLAKRHDVEFTFAGEGPEEGYLRGLLGGCDRVAITRYPAERALDIHLAHDVAVVPSVASEGTSLSVAEAMAAGCGVCATNVGGITNMVIHGYNGLLVHPKGEELRDGVESLIQDGGLRQRLGQRAFETASAAFSLESWQASWKRVLLDMSGG